MGQLVGEPLEDPREAAGLEVLDECAREEARLFARRARQLVETARLSRELEALDGRPRFAVLDLAASLRVGQQSAQGQLAHAERLVADFPLLCAQLAAGAVLVPQARRVLEHTWGVSVEVAQEVDRRLSVLVWADPAGWVGARLTRAITRTVLQVEADLEPAAARRRHEQARAGRKVVVRPEPDGMGSLWALLPAEKLMAFARGLDALAARQEVTDAAAGVVRTADQRRADVLAELPALAMHALTGAATGPGAGGTAPLGRCRHPRVTLDVHVPMATLLGHSNAPGHLNGYGPISAHQVRLLLPDAHLRQVLVDAASGQVLSVDAELVPPAAPRRRPGTATARRPDASPAGPLHEPGVEWLGGPEDLPQRLTAHLRPDGPVDPEQLPNAVDLARLTRLAPTGPVVVEDQPEAGYRPSAALRRLLRRRDELCTGPGCATSSRRSDLDHADPWPHGPTSAENMRPHSRRCHRAKTLTWTTWRTGDGALEWTSPTGRTYRVPTLWEPAPALRPHRAVVRVAVPRPWRDPRWPDGRPGGCQGGTGADPAGDRDDAGLAALLLQSPDDPVDEAPAPLSGGGAPGDDPPPF